MILLKSKDEIDKMRAANAIVADILVQVRERVKPGVDTAELDALAAGIEAARPGAHVGDISGAIQDTAERAGYTLVREFVGHGIGRSLHEDPQVPNYRTGARGVRLQEGLVLAIEPMVNAGRPEVYVKEDGWTAATRDGRLSAHFEHSVAVTAGGPYILSLP